MFLLARALGVTPFASVLLSGAINAITRLDAPHAFVTNPEPTPVAFAFALILLAAGFLAHRRPLLASIAAGAALLYDPLTAAPFWLVLCMAVIADRSLRRPMRPAWPVLLVFVLILGNLIQLQAGVGSGPDLSGRISSSMTRLTQIRTPWIWVPTWLGSEIWSYLFLLVAAAWALTQIWKHALPIAKWIVVGLAVSGLASVIAAMLLLNGRSQIAMAMPPSRNLAFTVALCVLVCGAGGFCAAKNARWGASLSFTALLAAALLNAQVLDLLHLQLPGPARIDHTSPSLIAMSTWAEQITWGSSMFQFPDAGKQNEPGIFRALSRRSLWADWNSGLIADTSDEAGQEWWRRWQSTMQSGFTPQRLQTMLPLPIDYYVLRRKNALSHIAPVYENSEYVVYDAQVLRNSAIPLKAIHSQ